MSAKYRLMLFSLGGAMLSLAFPPFPTWFLAFFAFIPIIIAFENSNKKLFLFSYITFFIYHGGTNWWISSWQPNADPFLIASGLAVWIVQPLLFTIPIFIQNYFNRKLGFQRAIWLFPFVWVSFEWWHSLGDLSYPWQAIGYTQAYNKYFAQIADLGGVWFIGFLIVLINVILYKIYYYKLSTSSKSVNNSIQIRNLSVSFIFLISIIYIYGIVQFNKYSELGKSEENKITVGIIQPNINPWKKWEEGRNAYNMIMLHKSIQDSLLKERANIDLFLWSETAITYLNSDVNTDHKFNFLNEWVNESKTSILTGFSDFYFYKPGETQKATTKLFLKDPNRAYDTYNSAVLINYDTLNRPAKEIYHKMKLTPFSEYLPYPELLTFLRRFVEWGVGISSWAKGEEQKYLNLITPNKSAKVAPIICIESIYPYFVSGFTDLGAEVLAIITNDGWYDYTFGPEQHFAIAEIRAIENRRYLARCANTGISGFINPAGTRMITADQYKVQGLVGDIYKLTDKSFYVKYGDLIAYLSVSIVIILWLILIFKKS